MQKKTALAVSSQGLAGERVGEEQELESSARVASETELDLDGLGYTSQSTVVGTAWLMLADWARLSGGVWRGGTSISA